MEAPTTSSTGPTVNHHQEPSDRHDSTVTDEAAETTAERARLTEERERLRAQRIRLGLPIALIAIGASATFAGGLYVFAANHGGADCDESCGDRSPMRAVGATVLVSGLASLAAGIGMISVRVEARERRIRELQQLDREIDALSSSTELAFTPWLQLGRHETKGACAGLSATIRF